MISPYLKRPLRALNEILSEPAAEGQPGASASPRPAIGEIDNASERDAPVRRTGTAGFGGR